MKAPANEVPKKNADASPPEDRLSGAKEIGSKTPQSKEQEGEIVVKMKELEKNVETGLSKKEEKLLKAAMKKMQEAGRFEQARGDQATA